MRSMEDSEGTPLRNTARTFEDTTPTFLAPGRAAAGPFMVVP